MSGYKPIICVLHKVLKAMFVNIARSYFDAIDMLM